MPSRSSNFTVSQNLTVARPVDEPAITIAVADWDILMARVRACTEPGTDYKAILWGCVGIAIAAALGAATFPFGVQWTRPTDSGGSAVNLPALLIEFGMIALSLATAIGAVMALVLARLHKREQSELRDWVLKDMARHKARHHPQSASTASAASAPAVVSPTPPSGSAGASPGRP